MNYEVRIMNYEKKNKVAWRLRHNSVFILHNSAQKGFALLELIIATALFGIIASLILLTYSKVGAQFSLSSLAYEIALSFRQAQSYGISVHEFRGGGSGTFDVGYRLHFDRDSLTTYVLFADAQDIGSGTPAPGEIFNTAYTEIGCSGIGPGCVSVFRLEKGNRIYKFCGVLPLDAGRDVADANKREECSPVSPPGVGSTPPSDPPPNISVLDITFLRPNPDAIIKTTLSTPNHLYKAARVYIVSPTGSSRVIEVTNTGQISIK